jgi:hypothetical protein
LGVDHPSPYRLPFPFLLTTESAHPSVCELQAGRQAGNTVGGVAGTESLSYQYLQNTID